MKKIFLRFGIVIFTLVFGIITTSLWLRYNPVIESFDEIDFTQIPAVGYCELIKNPRKYDGKIIAVKGAIVRQNMHGYFFDGSYCSVKGTSGMTAVSFYEPKREELFSKYNLNSLFQIDSSEKTVEIIADGKFTYKNQLGNSDAMKDKTHLQFEMYGIELYTVVMEEFNK